MSAVDKAARLGRLRAALRRIEGNGHGFACQGECSICVAGDALKQDDETFDPEALADEAVVIGQDVDRVRTEVAKVIREAYERGKKDARQSR